MNRTGGGGGLLLNDANPVVTADVAKTAMCPSVEGSGNLWQEQ